jgi:hypothetical protein
MVSLMAYSTVASMADNWAKKKELRMELVLGYMSE